MKHYPDGRFLEYKFNRDIAQRVVSYLVDRGYDASQLVPELEDISLAERCRRVNTWCQEHGSRSAILVSIHANAFGNGREWTSPRGWSVYTSKGQTRADLLADDIATAAKKHLTMMPMRGDWADDDIDYEEGFYILRHTLCPAVIAENCFMTNPDDLMFLESGVGKQKNINLHVEGIVSFVMKQK